MEYTYRKRLRALDHSLAQLTDSLAYIDAGIAQKMEVLADAQRLLPRVHALVNIDERERERLRMGLENTISTMTQQLNELNRRRKESAELLQLVKESRAGVPEPMWWNLLGHI